LGPLGSELFAFELKLRGLFFSRQLTFRNVQVGVQNVPLDEVDEEKYKAVSAFWIKVFRTITFTVELLKLKGENLKTLLSTYWSAHLRFFRSYCLSLKVKATVELVHEASRSGRSVIISVASTDNEDGLNGVSSASNILKNFIVNNFPGSSFKSGIWFFAFF
jgi:hypothetical protein